MSAFQAALEQEGEPLNEGIDYECYECYFRILFYILQNQANQFQPISVIYNRNQAKFVLVSSIIIFRIKQDFLLSLPTLIIGHAQPIISHLFIFPKPPTNRMVACWSIADCYIGMEEGQIADVEEALLVISMKNDEIGNLKASIRSTEKKHALKLTDFQFRLDQEKAKATQLDRKLAKADEALQRTRQQADQATKRCEVQSQTINEARRKERQLRAVIFEGQLQLQRQKENSSRLAAELQVIQRYFDPKRILSALQKRSLEEVPSYMQVYKMGLQRAEEARLAGLEVERLRAETYHSIEESFRKLSSYQAVMESLHQKNRELEQGLKEKQAALQEHSNEINEKKQLLQAIKEQANEQVDHLNEQLNTLNAYYRKPSEEITPQVDPAKYQHYQRALQDLQATLEEREAQIAQLQADFQERVLHLQEENTALKNDIIGIHISALAQKEDLEHQLIALRRDVSEKQELIALLNNAIREQEEFFEQKQKEFDKHTADLTELLRRRKRAQEESKEVEAQCRAKIENLTEELSFLKNQLAYRKSSVEQQENPNIAQPDNQQLSPNDQAGLQEALRRVRSGLQSVRSGQERHNLLSDLREDQSSGEQERLSRVDFGNYQLQPNWSELYYSLLQKHNEFSRKVQQRLLVMSHKQVPSQ